MLCSQEINWSFILIGWVIFAVLRIASTSQTHHRVPDKIVIGGVPHKVEKSLFELPDKTAYEGE